MPKKSFNQLGTSDQRFNKALNAYVVFIFDVLEHEMGLKTIPQLKKVTRLSSSTIYNIRRLAEAGKLTNRRQVRTIQRLAEVANVHPFVVPMRDYE